MAASELDQSEPTIALDVFRYRPDQEDEFTFQRYEVPYRRSTARSVTAGRVGWACAAVAG